MPIDELQSAASLMSTCCCDPTMGMATQQNPVYQQIGTLLLNRSAHCERTRCHVHKPWHAAQSPAQTPTLASGSCAGASLNALSAYCSASSNLPLMPTSRPCSRGVRRSASLDRCSNDNP